MRHARLSLFATVLLATLTMGFEGPCLAAGGPSLLVVPARRRVVQLALQIHQLSKVGIVSYATTPDGTPFLHVWNGNAWVQISTEDYLGGTFLPSSVENLVVVAPPGMLPGVLAADQAWASRTHRLPTLDTAELINQIGAIVGFTPLQWRRLAEYNELKIEDLNAERRRYGRYGPPGTTPKTERKTLKGVKLPPPPEVPTGKVEVLPPPPELPAEPPPAAPPAPPAPPAPAPADK